MSYAVAVQPVSAIAPDAHTQNRVQYTEEHIDGSCYQVARVVVKARPEQVWNVLTDYDRAAHVFPSLKRCEVLSDHGATKIVRHEIKPSGVMKSFTYDVQITENANRSLRWHRTAGDFKDVRGFWKLEPIENGRGTIVTYASYCNGGFFLPQALIKRQCRIDMPQVMAALRDHAEKTTQIAQRKVDHRIP